MSEKSSVERANNFIADAMNDALLNEDITIDDLIEAIQKNLKYYKDLGKRLTPTKRRVI